MGGEGEGGVSKHVQIRRGARKTAGAARGRQRQRREESSGGGARKAVAAAQGRQSQRHKEGSRGGARKAGAASRGRQSRRRKEGTAAARGRQSQRREEGSGGGVDAREIEGVLKYIQKWLTWQWLAEAEK